MGVKIDVVTIDSSSTNFGGIDLLHRAVEGVATRYVKVPNGTLFTSKSMPSKARVVVFLKGKGTFQFSNNKTIKVDEIALLAFMPDISYQLQVEYLNVEFLEIIMDLSINDLAEIRSKTDAINPYILKYSEATRYTETIKSEKTINRTLLPGGIIPRLVMGSVETTGPDKVEAHEHSMLEQFFFGLPGNNCSVFADDQEIVLKENALVHIPLGSVHGAYVNEGNLLHYLWIDIFKQQDDMSYIEEQHHQVEERRNI